jgi:hypothetical protein
VYGRSSLAAIGCVLALLLAGTAGAGLPTPFFSKSFTPSTIGPGSTSTLSYMIDGAGIASPATDLAFVEVLPADLVIATPSRLATTCVNATVTGPAGGSTIALSGGRLATASVCSVTVDVTSAVAGAYSSTSGDLTSSAGNSGPSQATLTVDASLPGFRLVVAPATVSPGAQSSLTFDIDNSANASDISTLSFGAILPAGLVIASPANAATDCGSPTLPANVTADPGTREISLFANGLLPSFPALVAGGLCVVTVDVEASMAGTFDLVTGDLLAGNLNAGRAAGRLEVERKELQKLFVDDPTLAGEMVELQYTLTNLDRFESVALIAFSDDLGAALVGLAVTGPLPPTPCGAGSAVSGTSVVTFAGGSLGAGESCTFSLTLTVPADAVPSNYLSTTSLAGFVKGGQAGSWDAAVDRLRVVDNPFSFSKDFLDDPIGVGSITAVRYSITNESSAVSATDIGFIDELAPPFGFPVSFEPFPLDPCGPGSSLAAVPTGSLEEQQGVQLSAGTLAPDAVCEFDVGFSVPVDLASGIFELATQPITGTVDGSTVQGESASAVALVVAAPLVFTSEFIDDPVESPETATLQFILFNDSEGGGSITDIAFTDDLGATLAGLSIAALAPDDFCGPGSQMSGTTTLSVTGATLLAGESCVFDVSLTLPAGATPGSYLNGTSNVSANVNGIAVNAPPAESELLITGLEFSMRFVDDPVVPGGQVVLEYTIENLTSNSTATGILFVHSFANTLSALALTGGLPTTPCGPASVLSTSGPSVLILQSGALTPGETCSFSVTLSVPPMAVPDAYPSSTGVLSATLNGAPVFPGATDLLTVALAPNDLCIESTIVDDMPTFQFDDAQDTTLATADGSDPTPDCGMGADGATVWYSFVASENEPVQVSTTGSNYDTVVSVWQGSEASCGSLTTQVACNDDLGMGVVTSLAEFDAVAGTSYLIQVGARNSGEGGDLVVAVPEPGSRWLFVAAVASLGWLRRRASSRRLR